MKRTLASTPLLKEDTLVHRLHSNALAQPEKPAYVFLRYGKGGINESITYKELDLRARVISTCLQQRGAQGKPVLLLFPSSLEYIAAYFGCLYAGAIAVPAYVPHSPRDLPRIQSIVADAGAHIALTTADERTKVARWLEPTSDLARLTWLATDTLENDEFESWQGTHVTGDTLAFLQYTSGSTTVPKGVMVSHSNLIHNLSMLHAYWKVDEIANPVGVYWLPIFHDMGLILGLLSPLYSGYPSYFMSPTDFLQRPLRWLQAISDFRGTLSCAPNFAYELCLHRITPEDRSQLDLSCWVGAGNAAEPVRSDTIECFTRAFSTCGFSPTAMRPAYGLAEGTLVVTSGYRGEPAKVVAISRQRLEDGSMEPPDDPEQPVQHIVGCGQPRATQRVIIVDPETLQRSAPSQVGEIWVSGPSVAQGYWRRPQESAETFQAYLATGEGPFLRTGDLGVFRDENLFITGRSKDLIIINGRNLYPQDIERTTEQAHTAIRTGCCAAFSLEQDGVERLIVLAEISHRYRPQGMRYGNSEQSQPDKQEIITSVRRAIADRHAVHAHQVVLLQIGGVLKTSSGKVQRRACRNALVQGMLKMWDTPERAAFAYERSQGKVAIQEGF